METWEIVSKDLVKKVTTEEVLFDLKKLRVELGEIDKQLKDAESLPDEILMPNDDKRVLISLLNSRREELNKIIGIK